MSQNVPIGKKLFAIGPLAAGGSGPGVSIR